MTRKQINQSTNQPSARTGRDRRSVFKQSTLGFNIEFSFSLISCLTESIESNMPFHLPIARLERSDNFMFSFGILAGNETQIVSRQYYCYIYIYIHEEKRPHTFLFTPQQQYQKRYHHRFLSQNSTHSFSEIFK